MTEITDINGYACRAVPCASVVPSSSPSKPGSLSKRSRMDSIFPFVTGDFCWHVRRVFRWIRGLIPRVVSGGHQRKTCVTGEYFVSTGTRGGTSSLTVSFPILLYIDCCCEGCSTRVNSV